MISNILMSYNSLKNFCKSNVFFNVKRVKNAKGKKF